MKSNGANNTQSTGTKQTDYPEVVTAAVFNLPENCTGQEKEAEILHLLLHSPETYNGHQQDYVPARNQELYPDLPYGNQGPGHLSYHWLPL